MDLVAGVLHELQTPIAAILTAAENIRDGLLEDPDRLREEGTSIVAHATRLMNLGDQILLYASTDKPGLRRNIRPLTAAEVIDNAVEGVSSFLRQGGFTLEREVPSGLPCLRGDSQLLSQCLENLIVNAVKYSGQSRWVGISAQLAESSITGREEIRIRVCDRGLGISAEDLPYIFEPFFRGRRPGLSAIRGSGLGLAIAKGCVEACGGALSVVSQEGAGCAFTLHLPLHGAPTEPEQYMDAHDERSLGDFKVDPSSSSFAPVELFTLNLIDSAGKRIVLEESADENPGMGI